MVKAKPASTFVQVDLASHRTKYFLPEYPFVMPRGSIFLASCTRECWPRENLSRGAVLPSERMLVESRSKWSRWSATRSLDNLGASQSRSRRFRRSGPFVRRLPVDFRRPDGKPITDRGKYLESGESYKTKAGSALRTHGTRTCPSLQAAKRLVPSRSERFSAATLIGAPTSCSDAPV